MITNPKTLKLIKDLEKTYNEMVDSFSLEELIGHFYAELQVRKDFQKHNMPGALTTEKIDMFERAIKEFEAVYKAEKAEAEKMPLSWHEANHVRNLLEEIDDSFNPIPEKRAEH